MFSLDYSWDLVRLQKFSNLRTSVFEFVFWYYEILSENIMVDEEYLSLIPIYTYIYTHTCIQNLT